MLYQRWEYTDQSHSNSRMLFHMNPDGTDQREFRGSGSWFPGSFFYARAIPGEPHQVIGVAGGHHGTPRSGRLLILDPSQGRRDGEGIVQEIPGRGQNGRADRARPAGGWRLAAVPHALAAEREVSPGRGQAPARLALGHLPRGRVRQPHADQGSRRRGPALAHRRCRTRRSRR